MKKEEIAFGVYDREMLLTHDPDFNGLGWKYPAIFSSQAMAQVFKESQKERGNFIIKEVVISVI